MQLLKRFRLSACNRGSRALAIFLAVMAVLTMVSRAVDSLLIPQVAVCDFEERKLEYPVEIAGRVGTVGKRAIYCQDNLRIDNVWVQQNDTVEKGDLLFTLDLEFLEEEIRRLELETHKYDLQIEDIENAYQQQVSQLENNFGGTESGTWNSIIVTADQGSMDLPQSDNTGAAKDNAAALLQLDKRETQLTLDSLYALREQEGKICAEFAGCVLECRVSAGSITSPEPVMVLEDFSQELRFEGTVGRDGEPHTEEKTAGVSGQADTEGEIADAQKNLKIEEGIAGTTKNLKIEGCIAGTQKNLKIEERVECTLEMEEGGTVLEGVAITKVVQGEDGTCRVVAELEKGALQQTGNAVLSFTKESRKYRNCVPLSALYSGKTGYYVIAVEEDKTILGIQSVASFVPVSVIESNDEYAAVEGNVYGCSKIVVQANKEVTEGGRVRVMEE